MKIQFSKLLALLVATVMVICAIPMLVTAEADITISIPTLIEGETYEEGVNIPLMVDYNSDPSTISHVDFYADGAKIPGNIPGGDKDKILMWSKPLPGTYNVTAKVCYVGGGAAESDPVTISVLHGDEYVDISWFDDEDLSAWKVGSEQVGVTEDMLSTEYADYSDKTFLVEDTSSLGSLRIFKNMNTKDYKYVNVLIHHFKNDNYNEETGYTYVPRLRYTLWREGHDLTNKPDGTWNNYSGPMQNTKEGWNRISLVNGNMSFDSVIYGISDYARNDEMGKVGYGVAIAGVFLSNTTEEAMTVTPLIPDGQQNVSITMPAYRLNFNRSLNTRKIAEKLAGITMTSGTETVPVTYACSEGYLELRPKGNLALRKTYTVTIPANTLFDNYGNSVPAQSFTFTTGAYSCAAADPIPYVTYPAEGDTVATEGVQLVAKVLFPVENASDVKFYDNGTEITGTVTRGTGSEFVMNDVSLAAGSHTITVKAIQDGETFDSENSVTVTAAVHEAKYRLIGLSDGEEIALNTTIAPIHARTVGLSNTDDVSKVIYKVDGVEKATVSSKPFTWDMPFTDLNTSHTVSAQLYTAEGIEEVDGVSYKAVYVAESVLRTSNNFDDGNYTNGAIGDKQNFGGLTGRGDDTFTVVDDVTGRGGKVMSFTRSSAQEQVSRLNISSWYVAGKTVFSFDLYLPSGAARTAQDSIYLMTNQLGLDKTSGQALIDLSKVETDTWHSVSVLVDYPAKRVTTSIDDDTYVADIDPAIATGMTPTASVTYPGAFVHIESNHNYYFDNLHVAVQGASARDDYFVNGISYDDSDESGVTVTASVANLSAAATSAKVLFGLYEENTLIKAWTEDMTVPASNGFKAVTQFVPYTTDEGTGTVVRAFAWEVVDGVTTLRPLATLR